jgi:hypothetical protein
MQKKYGIEDQPAEAGIEEGDLEDVVPYGSTLSMMTPVGSLTKGIRRVTKEAAEKAPGVLRKLEAPLFADAVKEGAEEAGSKGFAKFIRGEADDVAKKSAPAAKETLKVERFATGNPKVKELQFERRYLDLKTPEGRRRLKEIDDLLKNRTYAD